MGYVFIIEATDGVGNGIHISYVVQKLISQSLSFACSFAQPSNIEKFKSGGNLFFRMNQFRNTFQPIIRNRDNPHIRIDRTESVTRNLCPSSSQGVKYR